MADPITRYQAITAELVGLYHERVKLQNALLEDYDDAYQAAIGDGLAYNPAAAHAKHLSRRWTTELNKIQGTIDGHLVELRYLDQRLLIPTQGPTP